MAQLDWGAITKREDEMFKLIRMTTNFAIVLMLSLTASLAFSQSVVPSSTSELLRQRLEDGALAGSLVVDGEPIQAAALMHDVYAQANFEPLWPRDGVPERLHPVAEQLEQQGLNRGDLPLEALSRAYLRYRQTGSDTDLVAVDLLATEALIRAGYQLRFGKVDPTSLDNDWNFNRSIVDGKKPARAIRQAINAPDLGAFLDDYFPRGPVYQATMVALAKYRGISKNGGWPVVPDGATLREGETDPRIMSLRARLRVTGQLDPVDDTGSEIYDAKLVEAVSLFQDQHGLDVDGAVGPDTLSAMNVPVNVRVDQLRLALERMRWIQQDIKDDALYVNIAGFRLFMMQAGKFTWDSRVVVGKTYRKTPTFRGDIQYLVLNPTWTVPPGILRKDKLPAIKRDPGYLARTNISVLTRDGLEIDPSTIDWQSMNANNFPYILRQRPGPDNALGQVKFIFPNKHFVFLHDTPSRALFDHSERAFSSGCIRVENPLELAERLLADRPEWDRAAIDKQIASGDLRTVHLKESYPVLIIYLTALVDPDGITRFYNDIYNRDQRVLQALDGEIVIDLPSVTNVKG
jgi:L,D-transpeptidase YcbB